MNEFPDATESLNRLVPESPGATSQFLRKSVFREVRWPWAGVLIGLAPLVLIRVAIAVFGPALFFLAPRYLWMPLLLLAEVWMFAIPAILFRRQARLPRLPRLRSVFIEGLCALVAWVVLMVILNVIIFSLDQLFGVKFMQGLPMSPSTQALNRVEFAGFLILLWLISPVAEELFFRGMLYNTLRRRLHTVVAATIQAVIFGLLHPYNLEGSAFVALVGLICALLYEWRKSLLAPMLLHSMVNIVVIVAAYLALAAAPRLGVISEAHDGGCQITFVDPGSAAETAGMHVGEIITAVDGEPVPDPERLLQVIRSKKVGDQVVVSFTRDGKAQQVNAVLKKRQQ